MTKSYMKQIDTSTKGRYDVTPLFSNFSAFSMLLDDLMERMRGLEIDVVAGIDALGFILGAALAVRLAKPFVPFRKGGKLPGPSIAADFTDYSGVPKRLELRKDALQPSARVLLVDEWIETASQALAAASLVEQQQAKVIAVVTIHIDVNERSQRLLNRYLVIAADQE